MKIAPQFTLYFFFLEPTLLAIKTPFPFVKTNSFFMLFCTNKGAVMALTGSKGTRLERMKGFLADVLCSLGNKRPNQLTL